MQCIGCGSTAVLERNERTTQGYRRFRCRACGKQFNERSESALNRTQYPSDVIALSMAARIRLCPARDACRVGFASVGPRRAEGRQPSWRC
jgi:transposase-like protein